MSTNPEYPYDIEELKHIELLLEKIPSYKEKLAELHEEISKLAQKAVKSGSFSNVYEIESLIYKAFYISLENRPFNSDASREISRLKAEIVWEGTILNRNIACEICGENRSIDRCHIIPDKLGGSKNEENILYLCPTHHRLFDRFMLSEAEWVQINWERKSEPSQHFAESVTLEAHKVFWQKIKNGQHEKIRLYELNEKPFIEYAVGSILNLFIAGRLVKQSNIYKMLDENIREISKKAIPILIAHGLLEQIKEKGTNYLILAKEKTEIEPGVITEIWQKT